MATIDAPIWRAAILNRMRDDGTYFSVTRQDEAGKAAFNAAFPALFQIVESANIIPDQTTHKLTLPGTVEAARVYEIVDRDTQFQMWGWRKLNATIIRNVRSTAVDVYSWGPFVYPTAGSIVIPDEWVDTLLIYGELYLTEHMLNDLGKFRGYQPNSEMNVNEAELQGAVQVLYRRWQEERDNHAMTPPIPRY